MSTTNDTTLLSEVLLERAIEYIRIGTSLDGKVGDVLGLKLPLGGEADERIEQVRHIVRLMKTYHKAEVVERPLSIVIFGPPGSGKSTFVKKITEAVDGYELVKTANLTQVAGTKELANVFNARPKEAGATPVFFFDEFDAARDGAPLGWLSWFLAPMQDGVVLVDGWELPIHKAVFVFAGGTAETLAEFSQRAQLNPETYRARKVPDFVSRLCGGIDIGGLNALGNARIVPRALALRRILTHPAVSIDDGQLRQLLSNGHYVHGVRSMKTLLDAGWGETGKLDLPEAILRQHFSRGKLDGQLVGISAGLKETDSEPMFSALTKQLLRSGGTLAYGGAFAPEGTLEKVLKADREAPQELVGLPNEPPRVRNYLGYPASLQTKCIAIDEDSKSVEFIPLKTLSERELKELGAPLNEWFRAMPEEKSGDAYDVRRHMAWALSLFRLRVRILQDVTALVVLGGKDDGRSWGRMAGIAEEVMIALALRRPVYVLGGAGGAARAVGQLLGLDEAPVGLARCLEPAVYDLLDEKFSRDDPTFEIPGVPDSPRNLAELRHFLFHRGVTTNDWPWNGLSPTENRELFACPISEGEEPVERAVGLIVQGLSRIAWKPADGKREASG